MSKPSHRNSILTEGLRVVADRGLAAASVRDIMRAAGAPHGSFSNHFATKDAFCTEILDLYGTQAMQLAGRTIGDLTLPPLDRLGAYVDAITALMVADAWRNGCLLGVLSVEAHAHDAPFQARLTAIFEALRQSVAGCVTDAIAAGDLPGSLDAGAYAGFFISALQGAMLRARLERDPAPLVRFRYFALAAARAGPAP